MKTLHGKRRFFCLTLLAAALFCASQGLFAVDVSLSKFELELKGLEEEDGSLGIAGTLEAGGAISFGSHFNLSASAEITATDILSLFAVNEERRGSISLKITSIALEFPFSDGWTLVPAVFLGEYADVASGDFLAKALKVSMPQPEFLRYGALSVFSNETETQGLGGGLAWRPTKAPIALAAYATWNGNVEGAGFNAYAQATGTWRELSWNAFAIFGNGKEDHRADLSADDFYASAGFSALVQSEGKWSVYMQAKVLPFRLGSSHFFTENVENRLHVLFEPRYTGPLFSLGAAFFLSPVMQEKNVPFLHLDEDALYGGLNLSLGWGGDIWRGKSFGLNFALFADANSLNAGEPDWTDILRICVSPFFKLKGDVFAFTASVFLNMSKITSPLSAGEINIHIEAAL